MINASRPIYVICGGPGSEHEISLVSGKTVFESLRSSFENTKLVTVSKQWEWIFADETKTQEEGVAEIQSHNGIVFPIIHGAYGEDGEIQELLEKRNIPFFGSGSEAMRLTIDKQKTGDFLTSHWFRTPKSVVMSDPHEIPAIPFPMIVKPSDEGSSVSLYKIQDRGGLQRVLEKELQARKEILVQEFVKWREFTCGVVEMNGETIPLLPTEVILTKGEIFDYEAKYKVGGCKEVTPAEIDPEMLRKIQQLALVVHTTCGCKDISRTDMILNEAGELVVLEINTIPGMTPTSFVPAELMASEYSVEEFTKGMVEKYVAYR